MRECPQAMNLAGITSLGQIVALARNAAAAIGNDTGPIHLIAATGCPVLSLFSAHSDVIKHGPRGERVEILAVDELNDLSVDTVLRSFHPRFEPPKRNAVLH
jgi:ADP-heptose:LPS heptosyltransferase